MCFCWCVSVRICMKEKNVFPCTWKRVCRITKFAWSWLGIFIVFTSSKSCTHVLHWYGQHAHGKVADRAAFPRTSKVPASGNVFMEMVTEMCIRTTFLLAETGTWKAGLRVVPKMKVISKWEYQFVHTHYSVAISLLLGSTGQMVISAWLAHTTLGSVSTWMGDHQVLTVWFTQHTYPWTGM